MDLDFTDLIALAKPLTAALPDTEALIDTRELDTFGIDTRGTCLIERLREADLLRSERLREAGLLR